MKATCSIEIEGHIIDSLTLPKIMDTIIESGANFKIEKVEIGKEKISLSYAKLEIMADN